MNNRYQMRNHEGYFNKASQTKVITRRAIEKREADKERERETRRAIESSERERSE